MNDFQKVLLVIGILLFLLIGVAVLFALFGGAFLFHGDTIAVISLKGEIANEDPASYVNPYVMREALKDAADDPNIVAVILNIDSGGGGVVASKEIARAVTKLAETKPVVAYISDIGASGAYYVAAHSDYIVADEDSLVGSIGVISTYMVYKDLLEEKLGINTTVIKSGKFKDMGSPYREMTEEERGRLQEMVNTVHQEFLNTIITQRGLSGQDIAEIETGDVFLGSEALDMGLIDYIGGFDYAVETARQLAESPDAEVDFVDESVYYKEDMLYSIGRGLGDSLAGKLGASETLQFA